MTDYPAGRNEGRACSGIGELLDITSTHETVRFFMKPKKNPFTFKTLETKRPSKGPRTRGALPRYVAIGNAKHVERTDELIEGRVYADYDADGELCGVEVVG